MENKAIVLAHGLFMRKEVMLLLKKTFEFIGYKVYNFNYKTLKFDEKTVSDFKEFVDKIEETNVYFVGHSMGGLLMRLYLEKYNPEFEDSCLVTIGTPHKGSSFGKFVEKSPAKFLLGTAPNSGVTDGLGLWKSKYPLGCIVGVANLGPNNIFNKEKGEGDGTVLKSEAFVENATDIIEIRANHTAMVYSPSVAKEVVFFITNKKFSR